jgi:hypothetical protein
MGHGTYKPCHGCGAKGWRYADRLCDECAKLLSLGRAVKMDADHQAESKEEALFRLVPDWPHFYVHDDDIRKELVEAFQALTRRVLRPSKSHRDAYAKDVSPLPSETRGRTYFTTFYEKALVYKGPAATGKAIDRLDLAVRAALRSQRDNGVRQGGDLLGQLARGEITVKKLNDETMKGEA